ncbi:MAG: response regulator [Armatimonadetes bacterium]|nr:response regulator [Armatimonadota bacterium]
MEQASRTRKRILVADDEPFLLRLTAIQFQNLGFEVVTANDGREALSILATQKIFGCILDVMMPYVDGLEVLRTIRNDQTKERMPVIMLSVKTEDEDVHKAYCYGADMYLTKPFGPDDIKTCAELISQYSF